MKIQVVEYRLWIEFGAGTGNDVRADTDLDRVTRDAIAQRACRKAVHCHEDPTLVIPNRNREIAVHMDRCLDIVASERGDPSGGSALAGYDRSKLGFPKPGRTRLEQRANCHGMQRS